MSWPRGMLLVVDVFVCFEGLLVFPLVFSFPKSVFLKTSHFFLLLLHLFASHHFLTSTLFLSFSTFGVVRSSKLETGLSSNDDPVKAEMDTTTSNQREIKSFHALKEECALDTDTPFRFRDRFQFLKGV